MGITLECGVCRLGRFLVFWMCFGAGDVRDVGVCGLGIGGGVGCLCLGFILFVGVCMITLYSYFYA